MFWSSYDSAKINEKLVGVRSRGEENVVQTSEKMVECLHAVLL